jgi:DNA polymerase V
MKKKVYALVDCDNFYVSCERLFRPDLNGKPVVVLSNNDGCIISRSNEVKKLGIKMGLPYFKTMEIIRKNSVSVFSSNYSLYGDISDRIARTLEQFSSVVQVYSIDESFLLLSLPGDNYLEYGREIRKCILHDIGIPTTVGIAYTKTLAKVASKIAKKNPEYEGVLSLLDIEKNDGYLDMVEVGDIWGVGRQYAKWLHSIGIDTAKDLKYANRQVIMKRMTVNGYKTVLELNNIECIPIEDTVPPKKSIASAKAFGRVTASLEEIKQSLAIDVARAAEKLRRQNSVVGMLSVFITTDPFKTPHYSRAVGVKLPYSVSDTPTLTKYALMGLEHIFRKGFKYKRREYY